MTVYHAVMGLKSVPLLEESYRWVGLFIPEQPL